MQDTVNIRGYMQRSLAKPPASAKTDGSEQPTSRQQRKRQLKHPHDMASRHRYLAGLEDPSGRRSGVRSDRLRARYPRPVVCLKDRPGWNSPAALWSKSRLEA